MRKMESYHRRGHLRVLLPLLYKSGEAALSGIVPTHLSIYAHV